jgi:hypothetical protein
LVALPHVGDKRCFTMLATVDVLVDADDSMARTEIPLWAEKSGNALLGVERRDDCDAYIIRRLHRSLSHAEDIGR